MSDGPPSRFLLDATCTPPSFTLPLRRVEVQGVSQDLTSTPWAESPQSSWGERSQVWESRGIKKKSPFPFPCRFGVLTEKWSCCLGWALGREGVGPSLLMVRTFWWIGVWYSVTSRGWWFKEKAFFFRVLFSRLLQWIYRLQWVALLFNRKLRKTWRTFLVCGNDLLILRNTSNFCTFKIQA